MSVTVSAGGVRAWAVQRERGSTALLRLMIWIVLHLGWTVSRIILLGIALYFLASSRSARRASREYLYHALGRQPAIRDVIRHFFVFSSVIHERVYLLTGRTEKFAIDVEGLDDLRDLTAGGRGCVLLGSHLGSFEALRLVGRDAPMRVRPVMYRQNASAVTAILEALNPELQREIIEIGRPDTMLRVREALAAGQLVGILADRAPGPGKSFAVPFFGRPALFPTGPFIAIAGLSVPALLFWGIRTGPRRYTVRFEKFVDGVTIPRAARQDALADWIARYAGRLEAECRAHPFNWFNFFPFWAQE